MAVQNLSVKGGFEPLVMSFSDAGDEEPRGAIPEEACAGADEEQHMVEPVAEHPREQCEVLVDVASDPKQHEAGVVGAE
jgi:hypothetical protein